MKCSIQLITLAIASLSLLPAVCPATELDDAGLRVILNKIKADQTATADSMYIRNQARAKDAKALAAAARKLSLMFMREIEASAGKRSHAVLDVNKTTTFRIEGDNVYERRLLALNAAGEAKLMLAEKRLQLKSLPGRHLEAEGISAHYTGDSRVMQSIEGEKRETFNLRASIQALEDLLRTRFQADDASAMAGKDFDFIEVKRARGSGIERL